MKAILQTWNLLFVLFLIVSLYNIQGEVIPRGRSRMEPVKEVLNQQSFITAIKEKINNYDESKIPHNKRVLILYHVGVLTLDYSMDVIINNIKIFRGAVLSHIDSTYVEGLYVFNLLGGENNPFYKYIPCNSINVLCVQLSHSTMQYETIVDFETHSDLVNLLGDSIIQSFNSILFMYHEARGPFDKRHNGEWLAVFTNLINQPNPSINTTEYQTLHNNNNAPNTIPLTTLPIGAVSTGMSCDPDVRLLTYTYMLTTTIVTKVFNAVALYDIEEHLYHNRTELLGAVLTSYILKQGISIASLTQQATLLQSINSKNTLNSLTEFTNTTVFNEDHPNQYEENKYRNRRYTDNYPEGHPEQQPEQQPEHHIRRHPKRHPEDHPEQPVPDENEGMTRQLSLFSTKDRHKSKYSSSSSSSSSISASIYKNQCLVSQGTIGFTTNNNMWCTIQPLSILFIRYGGSVLKTPGILCPTAIDTITNTTIQLALKAPTLKLRLPETLYGGIYRELYRQYIYEDYRYKYAYLFDTHILQQQQQHTHKQYTYFPNPLHFMTKKDKNTHILQQSNENVCFLVRSAQVHSTKVDVNKPVSRLVKMDLSLLIKSKTFFL